MPRLTNEQVAAAKTVDLLKYLQFAEPWELKKTSANEFRTVTHGSLVISKGLWYWNRGQVGGRSAIDYLIKVRGLGFVAAVEKVLDSGAAGFFITDTARVSDFHALPVKDFPKQSARNVQTAEEKAKPPPAVPSPLQTPPANLPFASAPADSPPKTLILPPETKYPARAVAYLQKRGIAPDLIRRCLSAHILFEGRFDNQPVCVFVGRDDNGAARFATMRGIGTDLKRDVRGSDKRFGFFLPAGFGDNGGASCAGLGRESTTEQDANSIGGNRSKNLAVFESPIDLLSHATLALRGEIDFDGDRLSLGGTSDVALTAFLERKPNIERVSLCLDNDEAGQTAATKIHATLADDERFSHIAVAIDPPNIGKDYNEQLVSVKRSKREENQRQQQEQR